jgi:hypothetical protein
LLKPKAQVADNLHGAFGQWKLQRGLPRHDTRRGAHVLKLESIVRRLVDNRRTHARVRRPYHVVIYDDRRHEVFRGKVSDLSRGGAAVTGMPSGQGILYGQHVRMELLLLPEDLKKVSETASILGWVCRMEERPEGMRIAVKFEHYLQEEDAKKPK